MPESHITNSEFPNIITLLAGKFANTAYLSHYLYLWENVIFSLIIVGIISLIAYLGYRKAGTIPGRIQSAIEITAGGLNDFVCGILGAEGRNYTPFIGTLFIYITFMNLFGLIPFMKSPTSSWSTTLALALCVFCYVQYVAFKELGILGYLDHMLGRPRGILAFSLFIPLMMFILHVVSELVRPISLSLRLRSNIWGDDMLLSVLANKFGIAGVPLLVFSMLLAIVASVVQAVVFSLLTTIYCALVLPEKEEKNIT